MSFQTKDKHAAPAKIVKNSESLSTPKKRKHDTDEREPSKKKKKRRTDEATESPTAVTELDSEVKDKKKKKRKSKNQGETTAQLNEDLQEPQDIELLDVPATEKEPDEEAGAQLLEAGVDGAEAADIEEEDVLKLLESEDPSSFYSTRLSLYLSIPAVSLEASSSSILATHLAPLLLTYFPPAQGIVLGFSNPVLSARPNSGINLPLVPPRTGGAEAQAEIFTRTADEFGVCWVWLTATFLVFRPQRGDELCGWTNVTSEGFVGLVSYNYFQTAVGKPRIPSDWKWSGPSREQAQRSRKKGRKGRLRGEDGANSAQENDTQETDTTLVETSSSQMAVTDDSGYFADADGAKIKSTLKFRVVDTEIVPAHERNKWSLQIDGTLLEEEAEKKVVEEERAKFERTQERSQSKSPPASDVVMSGALGRSLSREGSVASRMSGQAPSRHRVTY